MDKRIRAALNYIDDHIDKPLDLKDLSKVAFLSRYHFHRLFKKETGVPLRKFIELIRVEKAYSIILDGKIQLQDIALDLGYNDYETFSRVFKKYHQISPDGLRAVLNNVIEQSGASGDAEKIVVLYYGSLIPDQVSKIVRKKLEEGNYTLDDISSVNSFSVEKKSSGATTDIHSITIKNKFIIKPDKRTWQKVLGGLHKM